jgi:hypothetical protein
MKRHQLILLHMIIFVSLSSQAWAQQNTVKNCVQEWRADKAGFQAKGITEKAYVAACRAGTAPIPTAAAPATTPAPTARTASPTPAADQKTAKNCVQEWRADKAGFQAKGITEKAYVAACRAGTAPTPTAAAPASTPEPSARTASPSPAPPNAPPSAPAAKPTVTTAKPAPAPVAPTGGASSPSGQFTTEAEAKASCLGDTVVWVTLPSKIYHYSGTRNYGTTKHGAYVCEKETAILGMRASKNEKRP